MIFVDTGAFLALYLRRDQFHRRARAAFPALPLPFLTSNHVMNELATLLARQASSRFAADRVRDLYASPSVEIVTSTRADELQALTWMQRFSDKPVSFTDCTSFAIMRRLEVRTALTFDRHFRDAGFDAFSAPEKP